MTGYIKFYRKTRNSAVYSDPYLLKLWIHCLMKATHTERDQLVGRKVVILQPGEFVTGRDVLTDEFNRGAKPKNIVNARTLWRWMKLLEELQMLSIKSETKYSVVTITNWLDYQQDVQQLSSKRPTDVQQLSTNKNVKNVKNDKNEKNEEQQTVKKEPPIVADNSFGEIATFYERNVGPLIPHIGQMLGEFVDEYSSALTLYALKISVEAKPKRITNYMLAILRDWKKNNLKTVEQVESYEKNRVPYSKQGSQQQSGPSVFDASPETLERQRKEAEKYKDVVINTDDLPF